jgi:hypothetical protein
MTFLVPGISIHLLEFASSCLDKYASGVDAIPGRASMLDERGRGD